MFPAQHGQTYEQVIPITGANGKTIDAKPMREREVFSLTKPVEAAVIGEHDVVVLPVGTVVSVVLVLGDPTAPAAYEVEAFLEESDRYVLATVEAQDHQ